MHDGKVKSAELIIFPDGTLYHIDLKKADNIPPNLFLVGAAERVHKIAGKFDELTFTHQNKARPEFFVASGVYRGVPMAAMSIGIGVGPTEIALNELHALFEYDHQSGEWQTEPAKVNIIRIGTSGTSLADIPSGAIAVSTHGLGLDNLGRYYPCPQPSPGTERMEEQFLRTALLGRINPVSYISRAHPDAVRALWDEATAIGETPPMFVGGITTCSPGFFAAEGRSVGRIRAPFTIKDFVKDIQDFRPGSHLRIVNHEMESSVLFRIGHEILGYRVGTICTVLDNLSKDEVLDAKVAAQRMDRCIEIALNAMVRLASK